MSYGVETTERFDREFKKLDRYTQRMIKAWIEKNLVECENPRLHGKGLTANRSGQWRYRIGQWDIDEQFIIEKGKRRLAGFRDRHRQGKKNDGKEFS